MTENLSPPGTAPAEQVHRLLAAKRIFRVVQGVCTSLAQLTFGMSRGCPLIEDGFDCTQQWNNYGGVGNINAQPGKLRFLPIERQSIHELGYDDMGQ